MSFVHLSHPGPTLFNPITPKRVHLDFELAGVLDLAEVGADVWVADKDTHLILVGYALNNDPAKSIFFPANFNNTSLFYELIRAVVNDAEVYAWNANFERLVWHHKLVPLGFPALPVEQFHCTMAAAANAGLPLDLDKAGHAVGSPHLKDKAGSALMKRMARPRGFDGNGVPRWWHIEDAAKLSALMDYNVRDVEAEREIWRRIPVMRNRERAIWLLDQHMNDRGLPVDHELLGALGAITLSEGLRFNEAIRDITGGAVQSMTQSVRLLNWLKGEGYTEENLQKGTLNTFMEVGTNSFIMSDKGAKALVLRQEAAKTSTAKLQSIGAYAKRDGKARGLVQYGGAVRTLRWAGRGPQIQNFPRPIVCNVDLAIQEVLSGADANSLRHIFGRPLDVVSSCLRGVFKAIPGHKFVVCDFHAIEAIVIAWLADFDDLLDVFRRDEDVYVHTASQIGSLNRTLGKVIRLACGFGMGPLKFQATAAGYGLTLSFTEASVAVHGFRRTNKPIADLWALYEQAARQVIANPSGPPVTVNGKATFRMALPDKKMAGSLIIEKPAGGYLAYRNARIEGTRVCFDGVHQVTRQWGKIDTYGGKLVENVTQSVARDLLADAMLKFEGYRPGALLTTVHDEIVAMSLDVQADSDLHVLKTIMSNPPGWAAGMPLSAAGYISDRYSKA